MPGGPGSPVAVGAGPHWPAGATWAGLGGAPVEAAIHTVGVGIADTLSGELARARSPLEAELAFGALIGTSTALLGELNAEDGGTPEALDELKASLIDALGSGAFDLPIDRGLAVLQVLAALAPPPRSTVAAQGVALVRGVGVRELPWAAAIGHPKLVDAWAFGDRLGAQSSLHLHYAYGHREHLVAVLIDHELGGGVKDVWVTDGRRPTSIRSQVFAELGADPQATIGVLSPDEALDQLVAALRRPPCPAEPDQVQDVTENLDLLRARTWALAADLGRVVDLEAEGAEGSLLADTALTIKVTLEGVKPPIWRRLVVPADTTLAQAHHQLVAAFGWSGGHLHAFETGVGRRVVKEISEANEAQVELGRLLVEPGDRLRYRYDFGDDWSLLVALEDAQPIDPTMQYPRCTGGRRQAPPEDVGGVPGYEHLVRVLADRLHPEHAELSDWLGGPFDPAAFSTAEVNDALAFL